MKQIFALGITFLFVATFVTPMVVGFDIDSKHEINNRYIEGHKKCRNGAGSYTLNDSIIHSHSNKLIDETPPEVEIISPKHGSTYNDIYVDFSIKYTDDTGFSRFKLEWGGQHGSGGLSYSVETTKIHYYNDTYWSSFPGYNWMIAFVYDDAGNFGYDFSLYYVDITGNGTPSGNPPVVEIITPQNNCIIYTQDISVSIKCVDDVGIVDFGYAIGSKNRQQGGGRTVWNELIFFFNETKTVRPGLNWIFGIAYDENGSIGYDFGFFTYNTSKDIYSPKVEIGHPQNEKLYLFGNDYDIPWNLSIVIGEFRISASILDYEEHLQNTLLYLNDELLLNETYSDEIFDIISWEPDKFLLGFYEIRIIASDSFGNTGYDQLTCLVIS